MYGTPFRKNKSKSIYAINSNPIPETKCARDLGVLIDSNLKFTDHYSKIIKSGNRSSFMILRSLKTKDLETLILGYKTYVRSNLEYATAIWNPKLKQDSDKIEKVQKFFTKRALKKCGYKNYDYEQRLKICGLKTLFERRLMFDLIMLYKILNYKTNLDPNSHFRVTASQRRYPQIITDASSAHNPFLTRTIKLWNKIPIIILKTNNIIDFKAALKTLDLTKLSEAS